MSIYENHRNTYRCTKGTRLEYFSHRHREIELVLMEDGCSTAVIDGVFHKINKGDALIVFPNQLHKFISDSKEDYTLLLIPSNIYIDYIDSIEDHRPSSPIIKNAAENKDIITLTKMCLESTDNYAYQCRKFLIGAILGMILKDVKLINSRTDNNTIERIMNYCENHYKEKLDLDTIAGQLYLSKYYISRLFNEQLGISISGYINSLRIEESVRLLNTTELSVTEICFATGFSSIRTFNRVFSDRIGLCPKSYREKERNIPGAYTPKMKKYGEG